MTTLLDVLTKYREDQARVPKGSPGGGRWTRGDGAGAAASLANDPRFRLARALGMNATSHARAWGRAATGTQKDNVRRRLDHELANRASKLNWRELVEMKQRDRKVIADKILPAMSEKQRGALANVFGVRNEFAAVEHFLRLSRASLKRLGDDQLDLARSRALDRVRGQL